MTKMKRLPVGVQAFETFASRNCVYVDKTEHVLRMTDEGMFYFLSRPPAVREVPAGLGPEMPVPGKEGAV